MLYQFLEKEVKRLSKKHKSLKADILSLQKELESNPNMGVNLGDGFKKIRLKITSKGKGKSGGGRVIAKTFVICESQQKITFVFLWDKTEIDNVNLKFLKDLL